MVKPTYFPYRAKKVLNRYKHIDGGWFWNKYSAYPYIGCQFGCEFCYQRGPKYLPYENPDDFSRIIKVKVNAPELLEKELSRVPVDLISTGDYQPAEKEFSLSRRLLEVLLKAKFPVFIIERSPLVTRDIDLITEINDTSFAAVLFSVSFAGSKQLKRTFEQNSPAVKLRFKAMEQLAGNNILTGTAFMPVLPFIADSEPDLEDVVKMTADSGGRFVLAGGLTLSGYEKVRYMNVIQENYPDLVERYEKLYKGSYRPTGSYWGDIACRVRDLCYKHGIKDRMPRWIEKGNLSLNKRIAELLFLKVYDLELGSADSSKIWSYRKAAWTIDELTTDIRQLYAEQGLSGLLALPNVGKSIAGEIEAVLKNEIQKAKPG
jgi:DNA repair photolyase